MTEDLDKFRTKIWRTSGARFNAARRLNYQNNLSTLAIALLSLYVLGLGLLAVDPSLMKVFWSPNEIASKTGALNFISIMASVFILIISLLEGSRNYAVQADRLHQSAMELRKLYDCDGTPNIKEKYHQIITKSDANHAPWDDRRFLCEHHKDDNLERSIKALYFDYWIVRIFFIVTNYFNYSGKYWFLIISPLVLFSITVLY